jgi:hypothetical protein
VFRSPEAYGPSRMSRTILVTAFIGLLGAPMAVAQNKPALSTQLTLADLVKERGGTARINYSAKLRMLSQRVAAMSCIYASDAKDDAAKAGLAAAQEEFEKIVKALELGDDTLGILGPEDSAKILKGLKVIAEEWGPMNTATASLLAASGNSPADLAVIYQHEAKVLKIAQKLATEVGAIYADPASISTANALVIDIAGRQRMLLQKMKKEACQISTGGATAETPDMLKASVSTFEVTLTALIDGMPEAGVQPAPTPEIRGKLEKILADWQIARAPFDTVLSGTPLDPAGLNELLATTDALTKAMNDVVADYAAASTY